MKFLKTQENEKNYLENLFIQKVGRYFCSNN